MGAEMIVHYGHSCLIPVNQTTIKTLYIFVEIAIDAAHLCLSVRRNFPSARSAFQRAVLGAADAVPGAKVGIELEDDEKTQQQQTDASHEEQEPTRLALVGTIQFVAAVQALKDDLEKAMPELNTEDEAADDALARVRQGEIGVWRGKYDITVPQVKPLSPGEILGCTAPKLGDVDALM
jgi:2-(3-amino-3-carboxypropyl)histidine synthase